MSARCPRGHLLPGDGSEDEPCPACLLGLGLGVAADTPDAHTKAVGTIGRYRLEELVGRGATGEVYRAWDPELRRRVALKMLHLQFRTAHFAEQRARFRLEASIVARLEHPQIVPLYDYGEIDGIPWMVQRLFTEGDLSHRVQEPVAPAMAARWTMSLADAVAEAHSQGVLHRDIKPSNVFMDERGDIFLGDFGLARTTTTPTESFTLTGHAMGSPGYMAPEQARGDAEATGPAVDIHGLGALLYHALTGFAPFTGSSLGAVLRRVIDEEAVPVGHLNPLVPADLEAVCMKCLEKEPARRYGNAAELRDDLGRFLRGEPTLAQPLSVLARSWRWCRRRPAVSALAASLLATLVAGLAGTSTAIVRMKSAEAERTHTRDRLAFELFERWANEHQLRRGLDDMSRILRESPGHKAAVRRVWSAFDASRIPLPRQIFDVPPSIAAAFNARGDRVLFLTADYRLVWVDARDGRVMGQRSISNTPPLMAVGLDPKGDHAWALRVPDVLEGWSLADGKPMAGGVPRTWYPASPPLPQSMQDLGSVGHGFAADGRHVALAFGEQNRAYVELRELPSGRLILKTNPGEHLLDGTAPFAPRGIPPRLLVWSGGATSLYDVSDGSISCEPIVLGKPEESACWHPDGDRLLVVPLAGQPVLFDVPQPTRIKPRWNVSGHVNRLAYSPDGCFVLAGAAGREGHVLDAKTGLEVQPVARAVIQNPWAAWTLHGVLTVGTRGEAEVVIPGRSDAPRAFDVGGPILALAVSADMRWAATLSAAGMVDLWDLATLPARRVGSDPLPEGLRQTPTSSHNPVATFAFHPTGSLMAMAWQNGEVLAWTVPGMGRTSLGGSGFPTTATAFHPIHHQFVAAEQAGSVWGWDLLGPIPGKASAVAHFPFVTQVAFDASGRHLLLAPNGGQASVWSWSLPPSQTGAPFTGRGVVYLCTSPLEASCLVCFQGGTVELRGIPDGLLHARWSLPSPNDPVLASWSPDGTRALVGTTAGDVFELRIPPAAEPVPDWFVGWVEALGQRSVEQDPFGPRSMAHRIIEWRRRLGALEGDGFWDAWGRSMGMVR